MVKKLLVTAAIMLLSGVSGLYAGTANVDLTVSPGNITVTMSADVGTVAFGQVDLSKSSAPAQGVILTNTGTGGVSLTKEITADGDWVIAESTGTLNETVVWCFSQETAPAIGDFGAVGNYAAETSSFSTTLSDPNPLNDSIGSQVTLNSGKGATTWYRIDVPNSVSNSNEQTITVQFTSTLN